ncbi:MAG TPA: ThuA domain-containing protein [Actinophytocola sp.]|jgi:type 1 glutamine amidotransferase|nr:ThuA domain-containing protein [Actinophytocola sp.]
MRTLIRAAALLAALAVTLVTAAVPPAAAAPLTKVLVFSKTAGFRHDSIPAGIAAIRQLGSQNGFAVDATEDAAAFTTQNLAQYQAVVWLSTTGDVLDASQQTAFESYVTAGGGYVGVHAAADTEYDWPWYGGLVGAWFQSHPAQQQASVVVEDHANPSTAHLPAVWSRFDEWYNYRTNPRSAVKVLASLDESTYSGGSMGGDHPITWCHDQGAGRAWYTGLGHTIESYSDPLFTRMLLGGIQVASRAVAADCRPATGGGTELARGRPVTVSSVEPGTPHAGANAVDGNTGTRWSSAFADPQWITVDLGASHAISRVRLTWETAYGRAYEIQTSGDGASWQRAYGTTTGDGGTDDVAVSANGRYVRVYGTQRGTQWGYSLWELSVTGT